MSEAYIVAAMRTAGGRRNGRLSGWQSGTKLMTTLLSILRQRAGRYGLQTICEGGGMANVTIVQRL